MDDLALSKAFLAWWNDTHDFDYYPDSGMYEKHAIKCFAAGWNAHTNNLNLNLNLNLKED